MLTDEALACKHIVVDGNGGLLMAREASPKLELKARNE